MYFKPLYSLHAHDAQHALSTRRQVLQLYSITRRRQNSPTTHPHSVDLEYRFNGLPHPKRQVKVLLKTSALFTNCTA